MIMAGLHLPPVCLPAITIPYPTPTMRKLYSHAQCCSPTPPPNSHSFYPTVLQFSTLESCCRYSAVLCEMADEWQELQSRDVKNGKRRNEPRKNKPRMTEAWLQLSKDRCLQDICLCMHVALKSCIRARSRHDSGPQTLLMKINEAHTRHLSLYAGTLPPQCQHSSFILLCPKIQQILIYWTMGLSIIDSFINKNSIICPAFMCVFSTSQA